MNPLKALSFVIAVIATLSAGCSPAASPRSPAANDPAAPTAATAPLPAASPTLNPPPEGGGDAR